MTETQQDPTQQEPQPPLPEQAQSPPGLETEMQPKPDYGEQSYQGHGRLEGKAAVITGGDSGIGRAVALAFAREGADVLISYLDEEPDAEETVRVVEASGRRCIAVPGDIGEEGHCQSIVRRAVDELGRLDVLVNNAAYQAMYPSTQEISTEEWDKTFRTNIYSMFWLCKSAIPHMPPGGTIINSASVEAYQPKPPLLAYATTKGAIVTFTKALSHEVIEQGIRVNAVAPGPIWTPLIPATFPEEKVESFGADVPMKRPGQPEELAPSYVFLASDDSSYISGQILHPNGGTIVGS